MDSSERDKAFVWHPYTDKNLYGNPIPIVSAKGAYLYAEDGRRFIDAVSSWWTCIHGHSHPVLVKRITEQLHLLDHVIFSGFTHESAILLAEKILKRLPVNQKKIFYSDDGSTAVEVALKIAFQYWFSKNQVRNKIIAFKNSYHGDTFGAMSVSARGTFTKPFNELLFDVIYADVPVPGKEEGLVNSFKGLLSVLNPKPAAFIFEPLVQGTAGMIMYAPEVLDEMITICKENNILTIADEVMTGFGRTGKFFACDYLKNQPDLFCLSKGLTGGTMAMGITSCTQEIFDRFNTGSSATFFHGHSFTGNPLACASGLGSLEIFDSEDVFTEINRIYEMHLKFIASRGKHAKIRHARCMGVILAIELYSDKPSTYFNELRNKAYQFFIEKGILLRPLGNIVYILPPYCISNDDLNYIYKSIDDFLVTI